MFDSYHFACKVREDYLQPCCISLITVLLNICITIINIVFPSVYNNVVNKKSYLCSIKTDKEYCMEREIRKIRFFFHLIALLIVELKNSYSCQ